MNFLFSDFGVIAVAIMLVLIGYILGKILKPDITLPVILAVAVVLAILMFTWDTYWFVMDVYYTQIKAGASLFLGIVAAVLMFVPAKLAQRKAKEHTDKSDE